MFIYINCPQKFLVAYNFLSSWSRDTKIRNHFIILKADLKLSLVLEKPFCEEFPVDFFLIIFEVFSFIKLTYFLEIMIEKLSS